jgi:PiT family inorganic phosphate transporter
VIGGLVGAVIFSGGWAAVRWGDIGSIATLWVVAPVVAAGLAALVLHLFERAVTNQPNAIGTARTQVPVLISLLSLMMANYFFLKLAPDTWPISENRLLASLTVAVTTFLVAQPLIHRVAQGATNNRKGINELFTVPLILAAAFFAFAHGANDVANVAAPLTALTYIASNGLTPRQFAIPLWTLAIGGAGIAAGLLTYGHRIVHTVGHELTEINKLRAFCVVFSAALVVVVASLFGFPVSTTHILVGSIVGVGLLREFVKLNERETLGKIRKCHAAQDQDTLERFLPRFQSATLPRKRVMLEELFRARGEVRPTERERDRIHRLYHHQLVRRSLLRRIILFRLLTLPVTALLGALGYSLLLRLQGA